jgi:hypothetical protein
MKTEKIMDNGQILAIVIRDAEWGKGLNFLSAEEDFQQVGIWGYDKGHKLAPHVHLNTPRMVARTQEVIFIKNGRLRADIYNEDRKYLTSVELTKGDTAILLRGGHGYEILEDNTKVLEIKNGPYPGAEKDRERI